MKIAVPVKTFSKNDILVKELLSDFPLSKVNDKKIVFDKRGLIKFLQGFTGAIIGLEKVDEELLIACPELRVISKYGVGLDGIDFEACAKHNVKVLFKKGVNKTSVAELALGLILSINRNIYSTCEEMKNNIWNKSGGSEISNKTVGVIGVGNIGKEIIRLLKPFNCKFLVNDIVNQDEYYKNNELEEVSKEFLLKRSDIVTVHTPLNSEMYHFFNNKTFSIMKEGSIFINTARGALVNTEDLVFALKQGLIKGAGLDVFEQEPPFDLGLIHLPNLVCTPHISGNSIEAILAMGRSAINLLKEHSIER